MNYKKQVQAHIADAVEQGEWIGSQVGPDVPVSTPNPATGGRDIGEALDLMAKRIENARKIWADA